MRSKVLIFWAIVLVCLGVASGVQARSALFTLFFDMFNQPSIKPQEQGSVQHFVRGTVAVNGLGYEDPALRYKRLLKDLFAETATRNPIEPDLASLADGKQKYEMFCATCHGESKGHDPKGLAKTKVNELGMIAPNILNMTPLFSDGYIYHKAKYGGALMPALGSATTPRERWDIVNYIRKLEKQ